MRVSGVACPRAGMLTLVTLLWSAAVVPAHAQFPPYRFVRIADTANDPDAHINGLSCVSLNNAGAVLIKNNQNELWRGNGGPLEAIVPSGAHGLCPSINNLQEIAYLTVDGSTPVLVRNLDGVLTELARSTAFPFLYGPTTYLPSLSDTGSALITAKSGTAIYVVPENIPVYDPGIHPPLFAFSSPASMNDSLEAVFAGSDAAGAAIFREGAMAFLRNGQTLPNGTLVLGSLQRPLINNAGTIAFLGRLDPPGSTGPYGVYTSADGINVALVGRSPIDRFALNSLGHVAYRRTFASPRTGIYIGRPGLIDQPVAPENLSLDGTTSLDAYIWEEGLNDLGQVAFWTFLADGRAGVYRGDPQWLKSLGFSAKIPGCGPINGKVTLNAPAPPGGLAVRLASSNAAASVPATVVVAAGRTSATFKITPHAVGANVVGDIEATVGPQTIDRRLTVRRIGVKAVTLVPNPVTGGGAVSGTVSLDCEAAPADITVTLSSSAPAVAQPAVPSLVFSAGTKTLGFTVTTSAVSATTSATIKAAGGGLSKGKKLTVIP
jgi:hypothetical protein